MPMPRKLVAVVDDDTIMLRTLDRLLNVSGFTTETYCSGESLLAGSACSRATCLVLDIHLEGMSGIELSRQLAASGSKLPVIFMTAFDDDATREAAMEAGCVAFLHKPFPASSLIAAIEAAVVE